MITLNEEKTGYEVDLPEHGIHQAYNPDTRDLFRSEVEAQVWQDDFVNAIETAKAEHQAQIDAENAAKTAAHDLETQRAEIVTALAAIDADTTKPRTLRELALGDAGTLAWVDAQNTKAAALRAKLKALDGAIK